MCEYYIRLSSVQFNKQMNATSPLRLSENIHGIRIHYAMGAAVLA